MIRAVLDTNVLASGLLGLLTPASVPGELFRRWVAEGYSMVVSEHILGELARTLEKPYFRRQVPRERAQTGLDLLRRRGALVVLTAPVHGVASHPEDDLVLATAVSGGVDYLVSGDKKLQDLGSYQEVRILSPRAFLDVLHAEQADP